MLSEVVMAVNVGKRGTVGCAYYLAREEKLYFMEDVQQGGVDVVDQRTFCGDPSYEPSKLTCHQSNSSSIRPSCSSPQIATTRS